MTQTLTLSPKEKTLAILDLIEKRVLKNIAECREVRKELNRIKEKTEFLLVQTELL